MNESAPSSLCKCRIRPEEVGSVDAVQQGEMGRTKDDLAAVQYADKLVPGRFIVIDLQQLYES